ncbi:MAG: conserved hypothetical signal peptide protein [Acidobacteria bacterium]|nr:conserved hypothetical signal peptide protein [Acidobacteriota bacterium]
MLTHAARVLAVAALFLPAAASAQTADELVARNIEAKGGLDRIKSVETLRMTGSTTVGPATEAPFVMEIKRPNKMRMDITVQGQTATQAFDGTRGWQAAPGSPEPRLLPSQMTRGLQDQADFYGPLVDAKAKGLDVEYAGVTKLDTGDAYKLIVTLRDGETRTVFLDAKSYLEVRGEMTVKAGGRAIEVVTLISDYRPVDGLVLPHRMESGPLGSPNRMRMTIEKVELNVPIDDTRFEMPK